MEAASKAPAPRLEDRRSQEFSPQDPKAPVVPGQQTVQGCSRATTGLPGSASERHSRAREPAAAVCVLGTGKPASISFSPISRHRLEPSQLSLGTAFALFVQLLAF